MTILDGIFALLAPVPMMLIFLGTFLGVTVGAVPGLTGAMLISLTLPLTFTMAPGNALVLLIAMYVGAIAGGLISATLLRMPGTPSSVMTTLDGYPMARAGHAARALGLGITASFVGGCVAWVFLVLLSRPLTEFGVRFGPFEKFSLVMMAMVLIAAVSRGSLVKGLLSGALGMMVTMPGVDPAMGGLRLTYGYTPLEAGLNLLPVLIGVFAVGQIIKDLVEIDRKPRVLYQVRLRDVFLRLRDLKQHVVNLVRSSLIGTWVGILPGIGANIASAMAWSLARNRSRKPEKFGKGSEEGIVAAESANSASVGGALIPLIAMGIPGSVIDAILLGAMAMHAVTPGALLFQNNPDLVVAIMGSAMIANVMMFLIMSFGAIWIARLCQVPRARLLPVILVFCIIGAFAFRNNMFDVWVMLGFGVIGFLLERCRMPLAPFVIGLVLAPIAESSLRSGLMISAGSFLPLVTRPISAVLMGIAVLLLVVQIVNEVRARRAPPRPEGG